MRLLLLFVPAILAAQTVAFPGPGMPASSGGGGGIAVVASTVQAGSGGSATVTTPSINSTGANVCFIAASGDNIDMGASATPSDSKGNTYTVVTDGLGVFKSDVGFWYSKGATVGSGHTFSVASGSYSSIVAMCVSGAQTTGTEDQKNANQTDSVSTIQPGSITPGFANEIVVTAIASDQTVTALSAPFTIAENQVNVPGTAVGLAIGYSVQTTATAVNPTWTVTATSHMQAVQASFR